MGGGHFDTRITFRNASTRDERGHLTPGRRDELLDQEVRHVI